MHGVAGMAGLYRQHQPFHIDRETEIIKIAAVEAREHRHGEDL